MRLRAGMGVGRQIFHRFTDRIGVPHDIGLRAGGQYLLEETHLGGGAAPEIQLRAQAEIVLGIDVRPAGEYAAEARGYPSGG